MFRDQALQPELTRLAEQVWPDLALLKGIDEDPLGSAIADNGPDFGGLYWRLLFR